MVQHVYRNLLKTLFVLSLSVALLSQAQTAQKPSYYGNRKQQAPELINVFAPSENTPIKAQTPWLHAIKNKEEFDSFARVYHTGTPFEIPHVIFAIDRKNKDAIYFINTPLFELHETFIQALLNRKILRDEINKNYEIPSRDFIFGTLSWQNNTKNYTYEYWEGDRITPELLTITQKQVEENFFAPVQFKTNSTWHEEVARSAKIDYITQQALIKELSFMTLNPGAAKGRLLLIRSDEDLEQASEHDIVVLKEVPIAIPPVAGVITEKPSTLLSHVNILTKSWGIPNIYLENAQNILAPLMNEQVVLKASLNNYTLELWDDGAVEPTGGAVQPARVLPVPNITDTRLKTLDQLKAVDSIYCGAKAANLGEIKGRLKTVVVPDGFCIPFAQYHQFMQQNGLSLLLEEAQSLPGFQSDSQVRKKALEGLRLAIMQWPVAPEIVKAWEQQWRTQLGGRGVFVRSSSNSEDLPNFSGAGLYTTTPNVKTAQALEEAVKRSWASVFNFEAYEARRVARMSHDSVMMSVLVQTAVDADASGVLITRDPFDPTRYQVSYMAAKRGIGIRVVEGKRIAEQIMYSHFSKAIQVLSRSDETTALQLDEFGGVKEVPLGSERAVLTDELVVRLAKVGQEIQRLFRDTDQDIEWAIKGQEVIILQARPYI